MALPGDRVCHQQQSELHIRPLTDKETWQALQALQQVFNSSYGPQGRLKLLHNGTGGHVTLTSTSGRLLHSLSISKPIMKLIKSAIQEHLRLYGDGGLLTGTFTLSLINSSLDLHVHRHLVMDIHEVLLGWCVSALESSDCACKLAVDVTNLDVLLNLVKNVIGSKNGCCLFGTDLEHIASVALRAFLQTFRAGTGTTSTAFFGPVKYLTVEGAPAHDSHVLKGIAFPSPEIPTYCRQPFQVRQVQSGTHAGLLKVLLYNVSMSGDSEDFTGAVYELQEGLTMAGTVLRKMKRCVTKLLEGDIGLLACQKVVHPAIKRLCKENGVLVLDRLGTSYISAVHQLAGGRLLSVFEPDAIEEDVYGYLQCCRHLVMHGKSYIHMESANSAICTVVLCGRTEQPLEELQHVCDVAQQVLQLTVSNPYGLSGAGCWQTWLAHHIWHKSVAEADRISADLHSSKVQFLSVAQNFAHCLQQVAKSLTKETDSHMTDSANGHLWANMESDVSVMEDKVTTCQCGMIQLDKDLKFEYLMEKLSSASLSTIGLKNMFLKEGSKKQGCVCQILDAYVPAVNAVKTAVGIANLVLGVNQYVYDTN